MQNNLYIFILLTSVLLQFLIIKFSRKMTFCIEETGTQKPQEFHSSPTSRAGGLGVFVALVIGFSFLGKDSMFTVLSALPVFIVGFYEDINSNLTPRVRLSLIACGAIIAIILLDGVIYDLGILKLPIWIAMPFTIFAVTGVSVAINMIDGFHGLASGVSMIVLLSFAATSYVGGDQLILGMTTVLIVVLAGFFIWNFPNGKIFLGDGGAYFTGFLLAILSVFIVRRNEGISPWFPFITLAYPIFEVFFSIYRKRVKRGISAFNPDRVHLHMLIYKRIVKSHSKTSVLIWIIVAVLNVVAFMFRSNTPILILTFLLFAVTYMYIYRTIVNFGHPGINVLHLFEIMSGRKKHMHTKTKRIKSLSIFKSNTARKQSS